MCGVIWVYCMWNRLMSPGVLCKTSVERIHVKSVYRGRYDKINLHGVVVSGLLSWYYDIS